MARDLFIDPPARHAKPRIQRLRPRLYGGKPSHGTCQQCIAKGQNNEAYAKELFAKAERTHPSSRPKVSGCCDSARNYIE